MVSIESLPFIVCSSCGSIIGHKYIHYVNYIEDGYSQLEAFNCLNITSYCCRMLVANPIVMSTNYGEEKKEEEEEINEKEHNFKSLTKPYKKSKEKARSVGPLKESLRESLKVTREYKPAQKKVVNMGAIEEESSTIDIGMKSYVKRIHKIYTASSDTEISY